MTALSPRRRRWHKVLVSALLLALFAAACGDDDDDGGGAESTTTAAGDETTTTEASTPVAGGEATILLYSEIGNLDPVKMTASGGSDGQRGYALYGALLMTDPDTHKAFPILAESFTPNADATVWTLKIKPDIVMSDGSPYDAAAVKANWDRIKDVANRSPSLTTFLPVSTIEVTDPLTVTLTLSSPNAHLDKAVARVGANYIASKVALDAKTDLTSTAIGAGPYTLKEWLRDDHMTLEKNPNWKGGEGPYLDTIVFRVVSDEDQRIDTFNTGDADAFYTSTAASVARAQDSVDGAEFVSVQVTTGQAFVFNTTKPPFNDVRMRTAFAQAVDWQAMADVVFGEGMTAPYNFTLEGTPWYDPDATLPEYDVAAAQALIDDYVADNGGTAVTIAYTAFQQTLDQARAEFIQTAINQMNNIKIDVQVGDSPTNIQKVLAADYMMSSWGFPVLDPDPGLYASVHSTSFNNYSKYNNPEVDALLDEARLLTDDTARKAIYDQVNEILAKDIPYYPYLTTVNGFVTSPDLQGGAIVHDGILRFDLLWKKA
jgi:peptide/nickel transport system substrate-binding protein